MQLVDTRRLATEIALGVRRRQAQECWDGQEGRCRGRLIRRRGDRERWTYLGGPAPTPARSFQALRRVLGTPRCPTRLAREWAPSRVRYHAARHGQRTHAAPHLPPARPGRRGRRWPRLVGGHGARRGRTGDRCVERRCPRTDVHGQGSPISPRGRDSSAAFDRDRRVPCVPASAPHLLRGRPLHGHALPR